VDIGTRIGSYEIVAPLGAGGMGEVYRARDTRIGRDIAIKVLPASFGADADRLRRFEQEARAAGALNHPNLVTLHELGAHEGAPYIVMELLEGETLREKLDSGVRIPVRKAVEWSVQIATALAAAHGRGVVHRDLKPENLFITSDGRVKILDFGLAKLTAVRPDDVTVANDQRGTAPGTVMGTVGYMAPEQVRGQGADERSDIFAFGAILYEMLAGRRAFSGPSSVETMSAILADDPPELPPVPPVAPALDRIMRRCLEKEPSQRFHAAHDLALALEAASLRTTSTESAIVEAPARRARLPLWLALAALAVAAIGVAAFFALRSAPAQPDVLQLTYRRGTVHSARFTPDGQTVVYGAAWDGAPTKIFQQRLDGGDAVPAQLPDADVLSVSPGGEMAISLGRNFDFWVGYGTLARVPLLGNAPRKLMGGVAFAEWGPNGDELLIVHRQSGEDRLEYPIGHVLYRTRGYVAYPRFSPRGDEIAFLDHPIYGDNRGNVVVMDVKSGARRELAHNWAGLEGLAWSPDGKDVWFTGSEGRGTWAVWLVTHGGNVRCVWRTPNDLMVLDVARDGRVLVASASMVTSITARTAEATRDLSWLGLSSVWALSHDGHLAALANYGGNAGQNYDAWLRPTDGSPPVRLGEGEPRSFSRDGKWLLATVPAEPPKVILYGVDEEQKKTVDTGSLQVRQVALSPDAKQVFLASQPPNGPMEFYLQDVESGRRERLPLDAPPGTSTPQFSPDATRISMITPSGGFVYDLRTHGMRTPPLRRGEQIAEWTDDGQALWVYSSEASALALDRLDLATGARTHVTDLSVDRTGAMGSSFLHTTPDGKTVVYEVVRSLTDLFVVKGLR